MGSQINPLEGAVDRDSQLDMQHAAFIRAEECEHEHRNEYFG